MRISAMLRWSLRCILFECTSISRGANDDNVMRSLTDVLEHRYYSDTRHDLALALNGIERLANHDRDARQHYKTT
jgi:hypothetical protein